MTNDAAYHEYYSNWYRNDPDTMARVDAFYSDLLRPYLPGDRNAKVLDVGAGIGMLLRNLKTMGYHDVLGVEVNAHQREGAGDLRDRIELTDDTASWLSDRAESFDLICCLDVLEHVEKAQQITLIQAITRALRPAGRLVCTVPNANSAIASRWRYNDYTHQISFTEHSLAYVLRAGDLAQIEVVGSPVFQMKAGPARRIKGGVTRAARAMSRLQRRIQLIGELGFDEGRLIPCDVNLLGTGVRGFVP